MIYINVHVMLFKPIDYCLLVKISVCGVMRPKYVKLWNLVKLRTTFSNPHRGVN